MLCDSLSYSYDTAGRKSGCWQGISYKPSSNLPALTATAQPG